MKSTRVARGWRSRIWRITRATLIIVVLLIVTFSIGGYLYLRQSLPTTAGTRRVAGLSAPIDIVRDASGVPHISARTTADALFGLGFAHAQDRLWQMEMQRRAARGRMSEMFGSVTIDADRFMRTLSLYHAAQQSWQAFPADARPLMEAYVAGINAFIASSPSRALPPEFTLLYLPAERWSPEDVIAIGKALAFTLAGNLATEALGDDLTRAVGAERAAALLPLSPGSDLTILAGPVPIPPDTSRIGARQAPAPPRKPVPPAAATAAAAALTHTRAPAAAASPADDGLAESMHRLHTTLAALFGTQAGIGSNAWVVSGSRTTSGAPLLANDVHVEAQLPATWYVAHVRAADGLNVAGATVPGLPAVIIGRNESIAWGVTNLYADTQDLFLERLDASGTAALVQGTPQPLTVRKETIHVRGGAPVEHLVRESAHGPLLSDVVSKWAAVRKSGSALALRWTALDGDDDSVAAMLRLNRAANWSDFRQALAHFVAPALSFIYADRAGNIGYYAAGRFPIRRSGDGTMPADGNSGTFDWTGSVPTDAAPQLYNPASGLIVTANNRPVPLDYAYSLGRTWEKPYRAERITQLLRSHDKMGAQDMAAFQQDTLSLESRDLLPEMLRLAAPRTPDERAALDRLRSWDGDMAADSVAATLYAAWTRELLTAVVSGTLSADLTSQYVNWNDLYGNRFLLTALRDARGTWCRPDSAAANGDCGALASKALASALTRLRTRLGANSDAWRWDGLHRVLFADQVFGSIPGLKPLFSRSLPAAGGVSTVNVGTFNGAYTQRVVASYRQVIDIGAADRDRYILAGGQSGHFLSPRYADLLDDWRAGRYRPLRLQAPGSGDPAPERLRLTP